MTSTNRREQVSVPGAALWRMGLRAVSPRGPAARLSIVLFHRVLSEPDSIFPDEMHRTQFDAICGWLAQWYRVLPLDLAVEKLAQGTLPERALSITFDDGYADNHDVAMPILQSHGLSATFFIARGFLDGGRMWNDTVVESVRGCQKEVLDLSGLDLGCDAEMPLTAPQERRQLAVRLLNAIKYLEPERRLATVSTIAERSAAALPGNLMMSSGQLRAMADAGMQIGAHTMTHPILSRLSDAEARREISNSKSQLEELLGRSVSLFAYPNGKPTVDYTSRDVQLVREAGFKAAVSTAYGAAKLRQTDLFQLPRFTPWDKDCARFGLRMVRNYFVRPESA